MPVPFTTFDHTPPTTFEQLEQMEAQAELIENETQRARVQGSLKVIRQIMEEQGELGK